jgi:glucosamine 6-phosphate synthetase-like amidotransferase/phosphosugar isomerase protein
MAWKIRPASALAIPAGPPTANLKNTTPTPTRDMHGRIAVVQNGIVENYRDCGSPSKPGAISSVSDTDTEVVPHLIADTCKS